MKSRQPPAQEPDGLFKTPFERFIDRDQPLVLLPDRIDWDGLGARVETRFSEEGRPGVPSQFMVGMRVLKSVENLSDEELFARWPRDPYFQYFNRGACIFNIRCRTSDPASAIGARALDQSFLIICCRRIFGLRMRPEHYLDRTWRR